MLKDIKSIVEKELGFEVGDIKCNRWFEGDVFKGLDIKIEPHNEDKLLHITTDTSITLSSGQITAVERLLSEFKELNDTDKIKLKMKIDRIIDKNKADKRLELIEKISNIVDESGDKYFSVDYLNSILLK